MTKSLENEFNLPPSEEEIEKQHQMIEQRREDAVKIMNALTTTEKIDTALQMVSELDEYEDEMNSVAKNAMDSYKDVMALGMNSPIANSSRILEVANNFLRTALDAMSSKTATKLKIVEMQLRKARLEIDTGEVQGTGDALDHRGLIELLQQKVMQDKNPPDEDK